MSGGRIEIDPQGLRLLATRMRGGAAMLSETGRALGARSSPPMPAQVAALVTEVVTRANADLQDLAIELETEARTLLARATWAELGGGDAVAWLIPGLSRFRSPPGMPLAPDAVLAPVTDEEVIRSERWAVDLLDGMREPSDLSTEAAARLGAGVDDAPSAVLMEFADGYADELSSRAPGGLTAGAGFDFEVYDDHGRGSIEPVVGSGWGAVGASLTDAVEGDAALGLVGGLVAGLGGGTDEELG